MYADPQDTRRCNALSRRRRVARQRAAILEMLGGACKVCGFTDGRALDIDHVKGGGNAERTKIGGGYYSKVIADLRAGSDAYQLLCCNCNQIKRHDNGENRPRVHG